MFPIYCRACHWKVCPLVDTGHSLTQLLAKSIASDGFIGDLKRDLNSRNVEQIKAATGTIWNSARRDELFRKEACQQGLIGILLNMLKPEYESAFFKITGALVALSLSGVYQI